MAVDRHQRLGPDLVEHPHRRPAAIALAQGGEPRLEVPRRRVGDGLGAREPADEAQDAGDVLRPSRFGGEHLHAARLEPVEIGRAVAARPHEREIGLERRDLFEVDLAVIGDDRQARRFRREVAVGGDADHLGAGPRGEGDLGEMRRERHDARRRARKHDLAPAIVGDPDVGDRGLRRRERGRGDEHPPHRPASSSRAAAWTRSTGSVVRHSLTLPPPQPSLPHGRHGCAVGRDDPRPHAPRPPLDVAARTEQRDHRRAHRGGDVHRRRIDADEELRARRERGERLERELAGEVDRRALARGEDRAHELELRRARRGGQHHRVAVARERVHERGGALRRPALEAPARGRVEMDEAALRDPERGQPGGDRARRFRAGHEHEPPLILPRIDPDPPQRVEVDFDRVTPAVPGQPVEVREALPPEPPAIGLVRRDAEAGAQKAREGGTAGMLGQGDEQVVAPRAQPRDEPPLRRELPRQREPAPRAAHRVHLGDRRMQREHLLRVVVDERVDLELRRVVLQHREHRAREQHVAVVAELHHQRAAQARGIDGVRDHLARAR